MKPLLRGELRHRCVPALFAGTQRASGVGGTRPPRLSPGGGNGKGGVQTSVPPQAVRVGVVRMPGTPLVYCELTLLPRFSPLRSPNLYVDPLVPLSRSLAAPPTPLPCFYPHSQWAALGPVQVGVRSQAQVHHHGDGPGLLGCCHLFGDLWRIIALHAVTRTRRWMSLLTNF